MKQRAKIWLAAGLITVVAGGGTAYAATTTQSANTNTHTTKHAAFGHGDFKQGFAFGSQELLTLLNITQADLKTDLQSGKSLANIAKAQGVDEQKVIDLLVQERTTQIDKAVTDGKLTQDKATTEKANLADQVKKMVESTHKAGDFKGGFPGGHGPGQPFQSQALLTLLNITQADLGTALQSGQSLADIAKEKVVDEQKVIDLLVQERTTQIDKAVTDGKLTQDQATTEKSKLADQVKKMVEHAHKQGDFQGRHGGFHKGGQQGTQSQTQPQTQSQSN